MKKITVKDWHEIQSDFEQMSKMRCVPSGICKVPANHIFDENQSVKWNREQAEENKRRDEIHEDIYAAIQSEVGHNISRKKAMAIWQFAYNEGHSSGFASIMFHLNEIMELADILLGGK